MEIKKYFENDIYRASFIILILTFFGNVFSYLFQIIGVIKLGPEDYGIVAILTSLIAILSIPSYAIQTVIANKTALLNVKDSKDKIKGLMLSSLKKTLLTSILFFLIYLLFSILLSSWLKINYIYFLLTGFFIFGSFLYPVMAGITQGMKRFTDLGFNFLLNCLIKFIFGIGLIYLGFRVYGAIIGFLAGIFLSLLLFFYSLSDVLKNKINKYDIAIFSQGNFYSLMVMGLFVLMFNIDVIFAKALFTPDIAGKYSVASLIGKIILFVISSIGTVMLPLSSENYVSGRDTKKVLNKTLLLSLFICSCAMLVLIAFPRFVITILYFKQYMEISSIMAYVGLAFCFLSFLNIYLLQALATNKIRKSNLFSMLLCLILEAIIFINFSENLTMYSIGFAIFAAITFLINFIIIKLRQ